MSPGQTGHITGQMGRVPGTDGTHTRGCPAKFLYVYWFFSSTAKLRIWTLRIWGFRGPGFRSARHVLCGDASRLFLDNFPKHLSTVLGWTELCHEVRNPGPQKTPNHPQRKPSEIWRRGHWKRGICIKLSEIDFQIRDKFATILRTLRLMYETKYGQFPQIWRAICDKFAQRPPSRTPPSPDF